MLRNEECIQGQDEVELSFDQTDGHSEKEGKMSETAQKKNGDVFHLGSPLLERNVGVLGTIRALLASNLGPGIVAIPFAL